MTAYQGKIPPIGLKPSVQQLLGEHLLTSYPREACGVLLGAAAAGGMRIDRGVPVRNVAPDPLRAFHPHPEDWIKALYLEPAPIGLYHSHPRTAPVPSASDLSGLSALGPEFQIYLIGSRTELPGDTVWKGYWIERLAGSNGMPAHRLIETPIYALLS